MKYEIKYPYIVDKIEVKCYFPYNSIFLSQGSDLIILYWVTLLSKLTQFTTGYILHKEVVAGPIC